MAGFDDAKKQIAPLLVKRLGLSGTAAADMAEKYLLAVADQAVINVQSATVGPSTSSSSRIQLVDHIAARLGRLPSVRELTALLRINESTARSTLRNVLATSDRASDLAFRSVFDRATAGGSVGSSGSPPNGKIWRFESKADMDLAHDLLETRGVKFTTKEAKDGSYVLVVDRSFNPAKL